MSKTIEYIAIGGAVLVVGYLVLKSKTPAVVTPVVPVTNPNTGSSSVENTAINDAAGLINNLL